MRSEQYQVALMRAVRRNEVLSQVVVLLLDHMRSKKMKIHPATRSKIATAIGDARSSDTDWFLDRVQDLIAETQLEREEKRETPRARDQ